MFSHRPVRASKVTASLTKLFVNAIRLYLTNSIQKLCTLAAHRLSSWDVNSKAAHRTNA
jgi:hypothetical protein